MDTEALNRTLIDNYLAEAREAALEGDQEEVCHFVRCVLLRAGLDRTEAYLILTSREAELAYERRNG